MPDSYTPEEAAAKIGVRKDTLTATLSDIGVDMLTRSPQRVTEEELEKLATEFQEIKINHSEAAGLNASEWD